jgi:hypothetical protein
MQKNDHVIVLNGRRYDARTGEDLSGEGRHVRPAVRGAHKVAPKSGPHTPAAARPHTVKAARKPARHVEAHAPTHSRTLMRQGVKRPVASAKRRIRVQGHLTSAAQPIVIGHHQPVIHRRTRVSSSRLINHFSPSLFIVTETPLSVAAKRRARQSAAASTPEPAKPRTTAELLEYAVQYADVPHQMEWPVSRKRQRRTFRRRPSHALGARA